MEWLDSWFVFLPSFKNGRIREIEHMLLHWLVLNIYIVEMSSHIYIFHRRILLELKHRRRWNQSKYPFLTLPHTPRNCAMPPCTCAMPPCTCAMPISPQYYCFFGFFTYLFVFIFAQGFLGLDVSSSWRRRDRF